MGEFESTYNFNNFSYYVFRSNVRGQSEVGTNTDRSGPDPYRTTDFT